MKLAGTTPWGFEGRCITIRHNAASSESFQNLQPLSDSAFERQSLSEHQSSHGSQASPLPEAKVSNILEPIVLTLLPKSLGFSQ
jgi:hypothetical protein